MDITGLIVFLLIGALAGWIAGKVITGRGFGVLGNIVVGIVGAVLGGVMFRVVGLAATGLIGEIITATVGRSCCCILSCCSRKSEAGLCCPCAGSSLACLSGW